MQLNTLTRLADLHSHLSLLRGADSDLLRANGFDTRLDEMAATITDLKKLQQAYYQLNSLSGALCMVLELLDASHNRGLNGDHLHCLLEPLHEKLDRAMNEIDGIL